MNFNELDAYYGKLLDSGRYKVLNVIVYDYSWYVEDLKDETNNRIKLLFKIKLYKHLKLLKKSTQITNDYVWKWTLFKDGDYYFAVENFDYFQVIIKKK